MTSTHEVGVEGVHGASGRPPGALTAIPALVVLLVAGLALRLTIAYIVLPGSGFENDLSSFTSWALTLADHGPGGFYANAGFADYPPGYLYLLWPVGLLANALAPLAGTDAASLAGTLIKLPSIGADICIGALLFRMVTRWSRSPGANAGRLGLVAAGAYLFNPITWYDSALWGQTDAVGALVMLVGVSLLLRGHSEGAVAAAILAGLVKPQFGVVLVPIVAAVLLRRHLLAVGSGPHHRPRLPDPLASWLVRQQGPIRLLSSAAIGLGVMLLLLTPFRLDIPGFIRLVAETAGGYPWLSVNAYNPWALMGSEGAGSLATGGGWSSDTVPLLGPFSGVVVGTVLLAGGFLLGVARLLLRADRWSIVVVTVFLSLAFFVLPTRVHERYLFPAFAFLPLLAVADGRWRWATVLLAAGSFINLHAILTFPLYATENVADLPFGELFRSFPFVALSVALQVGVFAFVAWQLRTGAVRRPDPLSREVAAGVRSRPTALSGARGPGAADAPRGAQGTAQGVTSMEQPWSPQPGTFSWLSDRFRVHPLRRDRSAELRAEPTGRLDRLDLLLVVLVILGALTLRTYRVGEPYDMHFDEVYHARTATEFLQDWRYGIPHSVYEYTHPHVAKYGIAVGLMALGNDRVTGTTDLGTTVTDAALETRWSPAERPGERLGDRLYVATGTEVRVHDLRTRDLVAQLPLPATALAVDESAHTLFAAAEAGTIWSLPTAALDELRLDPLRPLPEAARLAPLEGVSRLIEGLGVVDGSLLVRVEGGTLLSLDGVTGEQTGEAFVEGAQAVARVPPADRVVVDPAGVSDPAALAESLARILDDDAARLEELISGATGPVSVAAYLDKTMTGSVQKGIDDASLEGTSIEPGPTAAVAGAVGVTFLDAVSLEQLEQLTTDAPATDLALVEGLDDPTLYVPNGIQVTTLPIGDDGPGHGTDMPMPADVRSARWDGATNLVHVVGDAPDGGGTTVYVVEPHANAVFADARLPFTPRATVMDIQPDRPTDDRQDLLAFSTDGTVASVDVGSHAFAWRMPGVIMGALTAAAIFLLARVLFRRRSVAVLASLLVMAEGMFFANARIAMNDTYVTAFIVSAVALFAPLYLGIWRSRLAVLLVLPVVGLLLGLAFGTKWVGAYAIGFVVLLVLLRSALGRVITLTAMIGLTALLGYLAVRPADVADPRINATFLLLMAALTILLAAAMVRRPVRFTLDELRFAVLAPALLGSLLVLAGFVMGSGGASAASGLLAPNRVLFAGAGLLLLGAAAYGGSWVAARLGVGPLAPPRPVARGEPVPSAAPTGWLRPGWAAGIPWSYALLCLTVIPLAVYIASYVPWAALEIGGGNRILTDWPPGHTGQTLADLTVSMYRYHDELRATHAASSPWWAWPLDLKPVWFHQDGFAASTTGVIYDAGNVVIFWLAIPAVAFCAWQAWARRSLSLTLIVLGIACLWLPWARIDRATFQYHVFTSLPFTVLALAYFLGELWHGPSSRTYLLARIAGGVAILGPPLLWLLRQPLCGLAGTEAVHPDGVACGPLVRSLTIAESAFAATIVVLIGAATIAWLVRAQVRTGSADPLLRVRTSSRDIEVSLLSALLVVTVATALGAAGASLLLSPRPFLTLPVQAEVLAIVALLLLAAPAYLAARTRDPRRWVIGVLGAAALFFLLWYPSLTGLPLPDSVAQAYLGLLPTWNYDFQFAVNLDPASDRPIVDVGTLLIGLATAALVLVAMIVARSWRGGGSVRSPRGPLGETG